VCSPEAETVAPVAQPLEHGESIRVTGHGLAVEQAGACLEPVHGLYNQRIPLRPVVSVAGEQPDADRGPPRHQAIAVMLDFVNPVRAGRRSAGWGWEAGCDEARRGCPARA